MFATGLALQLLATSPVLAETGAQAVAPTQSAAAVAPAAAATPVTPAPVTPATPADTTDPLADPAAATPAAPAAAPAATPPPADPAATSAPATADAYSTADDPLAEGGPAAARIPGLADPLEPVNRLFYKVNQPIDRFVIRPVAVAYKTVFPKPLRDGARNAIQNLFEPIVIFNDVLQLHPGRAFKGVVRIVFNSTLGLGGLFDFARRKPLHIEHHDNSFADTLGYYGVPPLLYIFLPLLGPTTLRDSAGEVADDFAEPRILHKITHPDSDRPIWTSKTTLGTTGTVIRVVQGIDERAEADQDLEIIRKQSVDPYASLRALYLQNRAGEIAALHASKAKPADTAPLDDPLADPAAK